MKDFEKDYKNPKVLPRRRAELLLAQMSLEEKMGQVVGFNPMHWDKDDFAAKYPHGCGQIAFLPCTSKRSVKEAARFQREIQEQVMSLSEHHIPALFHIEGLCGLMFQGAASFPSGIGQGATWDVDNQKEMGKIIGTQARAVGAGSVLAPVLDVTGDARFGRTGESYGEDPVLCSVMGTAKTSGIQMDGCLENGALATAKHFVAFHAGMSGIHGAACDMSERTLRETYAKPFQAAITEGGLHTVMCSYNSLNGETVAGSKKILTDLLRTEMGFGDGYVMSDYVAISDIHRRMKNAASLTEAGKLSMEAGMDSELPFKECFNDEMEAWIREGKMDEKVLDQAVLRTLMVKFELGLFENPYALSDAVLEKIFSTREAEAVMLKASRESVVLLKNDGILPLKKEAKKIAVIGYHAGAVRSMFGGYTFMSMTESELGTENTMAGIDTDLPLEEIIRAIVEEENKKPKYPGSLIQIENEKANKTAKERMPGAQSLVERLKDAHPEMEILYRFGYPFDGNDTSGFEEAFAAAKEADLVILTVGTKYATGSAASEGEGIDSNHIGLPECQEMFLKAYQPLGKPTVVIHFGGRPVSSDLADACGNAVIEAFSPGVMGPRVLDEILFGDYNPSGKLPVTVVHREGQLPLRYNHPNGSNYHHGMSSAIPEYVNGTYLPRYYFGHGLSYTTFQVDALAMKRTAWHPYETLTFSVNIENTGDVDGDEVLQVYVRDQYASITRPNMELQGFKRVSLKAGEKKTVTFSMKLSQLAFPDADMKWKVEKGTFDLMIGTSSENILQECTFEITEDGYVEGKSRGFFARAEC